LTAGFQDVVTVSLTMVKNVTQDLPTPTLPMLAEPSANFLLVVMASLTVVSSAMTEIEMPLMDVIQCAAMSVVTDTWKLARNAITASLTTTHLITAD